MKSEGMEDDEEFMKEIKFKIDEYQNHIEGMLEVKPLVVAKVAKRGWKK